MLDPVFGDFLFGGTDLGGDYASSQPIPTPPSSRLFVLANADNYGVFEYYKTPAEKLNFGFDWSAVLNGDMIIFSNWSLSSADVIINATGLDQADNIALVVLSGGISSNLTDGIYEITNQINTLSGLTLFVTFLLHVHAHNFSHQ